MKNKIITWIVVFTAFVGGGLTTYAILEGPLKNKATDSIVTDNDDKGTKNYEGTLIVNNTGISDGVAKIYDAVVLIENYQKNKLAGTGSGFVYKKDNQYGYIMTNYHVIENANDIKILNSKDEKVAATVLGGDEYLDIAIVRIPLANVAGVAKIGSTEELKLGETVFAIGSPVGEEYFNSVTTGVISGLNRKVTVSVKSTSDWIQEVLQIDAAINPGNSGGPLLNFNGEVIGVNSLKLVDSSIESMGFSIKIEDAMKHATELESGQKIERPLLGINHLNATDSYSLSRNGITIDSSIEYGIVVVSVVDGSGASKSGLQKGDVIIKVNDDKVINTAYLKYLLYKYNVDDTIKLTYLRDGKENTTDVTLTKNTD